jgi:O-acetyl-ADP-ribose deacetylase (regulator of RNase III)
MVQSFRLHIDTYHKVERNFRGQGTIQTSKTMIEVTHGNILEADAEALVNTVNCVGVMGKGIALQFKQAFPDNFAQYERACRNKEMRPGRMFITATDRLVNPRIIINFPTKRHWKGKSRLQDIRSGLGALIADIKRLEIRSIAVPPLGCGNGGLDWAQVKPLIVTAFAELPEIQVLLFEPQAAPDAEAMPVATRKPDMTRARALLIRLMEVYREQGYKLTRLEIQKLAYFLQEGGEPMRLRYVKHQYGPYADNLNHVLQHIEGHYIRGYGDRSSSNRAAIYPTPEGVEAARAFLVSSADVTERLDRVSRLIEGFETPYGLELLATVHWVAKSSPQAATGISVAIQKVQDWSSRKRERFRPDHIQNAWRRLKDEQWLEQFVSDEESGLHGSGLE